MARPREPRGDGYYMTLRLLRSPGPGPAEREVTEAVRRVKSATWVLAVMTRGGESGGGALNRCSQDKTAPVTAGRPRRPPGRGPGTVSHAAVAERSGDGQATV
jgi:hypothetical protein